jgi:hypothetical protein
VVARTQKEPNHKTLTSPKPQKTRNDHHAYQPPEKRNWVPDASVNYFDVATDTFSSLRLLFSIKRGRFGNHR